MEELKPTYSSPYIKKSTSINDSRFNSKSSGLYSQKYTNSSFLEKAIAPNYRASVRDAPSISRVVIRFIQLVASLGSFSFSVGANSFSDEHIPFPDKSGVEFLYFQSFFSLIITIFFLFNYYQRRFKYKVKLRRFWLFLIDGIVSFFWICCLLTLFIRDTCPIGTMNGWYIKLCLFL